MAGLHDIEIVAAPGGATVAVDGADVGPVAAVTIQAAQGQVPQVLVQLAARATIRVEGAIDIEPALSPADLVRSIDPERLRQADIDSLSNRSLTTDPYETTEDGSECTVGIGRLARPTTSTLVSGVTIVPVR